ncbi:MGMT family protein [Mesorhizobium sp. KR1-2]|uniref:methylated-DNA--[protein]-cysteine S-methyltransferase n=1 Tax=Mesorhizobium sp. KR1-2 TaxID=3156609 RepID=UPI0032B32994
MREQIKFAWGDSSLGHFLVAVSKDGIVTFEFGEHGGAMLDALRAGCPDAELVESQDALAAVIAKLADVVEQPGIDPGLALDMRGSEYQRQVWTLLREIPAGETTSYGALAQTAPILFSVSP